VRFYAEELISGVIGQLGKIDSRITCASQNWSITRMSRVDRAILRVSAYEIMFLKDVPHNVVINEAVEIAKRFAADESPNFINGVLDRLSSLCNRKQQMPLTSMEALVSGAIPVVAPEPKVIV
jgi:N utilization substance protein B